MQGEAVDLRALRRAAGVSQAALAARLHMTQRAVSRLERARLARLVELLRRCANALGYTVKITFEKGGEDGE